MRSKRQMTMAKRAREQALRDRRARKQEKKEARRAAAEMPAPAEPDGGALHLPAEPPSAEAASERAEPPAA